MYDSFDALVTTVLAKCNEKEKTRVEEELNIIEKRGWNNYIVFVNLLIDDCKSRSDFLAFLRGSVTDFYLIWKSRHLDEINIELLNSSTSKEILKNDALRLLVDVVSISHEINNNTLKIFSDAIDLYTGNFNYYMWESITQRPVTPWHSIAGEIIVISSNELTAEEKNIYLNETRESTDEEAEILRRNLIIKISVSIGL